MVGGLVLFNWSNHDKWTELTLYLHQVRDSHVFEEYEEAIEEAIVLAFLPALGWDCSMNICFYLGAGFDVRQLLYDRAICSARPSEIYNPDEDELYYDDFEMDEDPQYDWKCRMRDADL